MCAAALSIVGHVYFNSLELMLGQRTQTGQVTLKYKISLSLKFKLVMQVLLILKKDFLVIFAVTYDLMLIIIIFFLIRH